MELETGKYKGKIYNLNGKTRKVDLEVFEELPIIVEYLIGAKLLTSKKIGKIKFSSFFSKKEYDCILNKKSSGKEIYGESNVSLNSLKDTPARLDILVFLETEHITMSIHPEECKKGRYFGLYFFSDPSESDLSGFYISQEKFEKRFELKKIN